MTTTQYNIGLDQIKSCEIRDEMAECNAGAARRLGTGRTSTGEQVWLYAFPLSHGEALVLEASGDPLWIDSLNFTEDTIIADLRQYGVLDDDQVLVLDGGEWRIVNEAEAE